MARQLISSLYIAQRGNRSHSSHSADMRASRGGDVAFVPHRSAAEALLPGGPGLRPTA